MFKGIEIFQSHQQWKVLVGVIAVPLIAMATVFASAVMGWIGDTDEQQAAFSLVALVAAALGYTWAVLAIRCPSCRTKLLWWAMSRNTPRDWMQWLMAANDCPACGYHRGPVPSLENRSRKATARQAHHSPNAGGDRWRA
jgi:hypothetical protein